MPAGRKPKPTHLKLLAGNPGHRRINTDEPRPDALDEIPDPPSILTGEARVEWSRIVPKLQKSGLLTEVDIAAIAAYCQAYGRWVEAESYVAKQGAVLLSPTNFPIQNPYLAVANRAMEQMRQFMVEFGMTPSARVRVKAAPGQQRKSRFLDVINGKGRK